jgi:hypothetical protein
MGFRTVEAAWVLLERETPVPIGCAMGLPVRDLQALLGRVLAVASPRPVPLVSPKPLQGSQVPSGWRRDCLCIE